MKAGSIFRSSGTKAFSGVLLAALVFSLALTSGTLHAQTSENVQNPRVILPLVHCWYKGKVAYYIQTEASDKALAEQQGVNYVPELANTISSGAVDDIYHVTNFTQGNVIPSAPIPAGPGNTDPGYTPLWQLSLVTWNSGTTPYVLKSEEDVLSARDQGLLTIVKTNIVINCPVIYTPFGGLLPTAKIIGNYKQQDNSR
ncbi:MAG: DUF7482 domain-containing protein [Terriglobales bacterium]